ncbi:LysR family transcriptional regulator [Pseudomonas entomophila]|uniref:LysR family transcriptional regulator n=1 Tax=Pseudomonas entomophila TaxID=312306 RepID=UPI0023D89277|nr:LysR family transcriptional regulator [Pseudomonas entomophila]MDF0731610.1 LysR family transcriptional regulator [Pseudomonas entomophila]
MDLFSSMSTFVRVVERGSFSAVARELNLGQPAVSKHIRALETHLGGPLFTRSTRQLALTDQGARFYEHCRAILTDLEAATLRFAQGQEQVAGTLRIAAPVSFGRRQIAPRLGLFLERHPQVVIDLRLNDHNEDLVQENIDVAIRIGAPSHDRLIALPLGSSMRHVYAAPAYLERYGRPESPADLAAHNCIGFTLLKRYDVWQFQQQGQVLEVPVTGNVKSNSSEAIREMVLAGLGIALSPRWLFADDAARGDVCTLLEAFQPPALPVSAVFDGTRRQSARVKAFVAFLREQLAAV